ncbi:MAG: hypothetical protein P4L31_05350, partial [Candidatus Babeliales bacterium]|nr:hypothetical protein [Candidatus Babeliales bacterium]
MTHKHIIHLMVLISFNHLDGMRSKPSNAQSSLLAQAIAQEQCEKDAAYAQMLQLELDQQENSIYPSCSISSNSPGYILINPSPEPVLVRSRSSKSTYRPSSRAVDSVITDYVDNKKQKQPIKIASISSSSIPAASASSSSPTSAQISISQLPYANILNELNTIELEFEEDNSNIRFDRLSQQLSRLGNIQKTLAPHYQNMPPMMIPA